MRLSKQLTFAIAAWGLCVVLIFWQGLLGSFFFDDGPSVLLPPGVKMERLSWEQLHQAWISGGAGPSGRPVAQLTFAINYFFSGFDPFVFKATNLAIHLCCGGLVLILSRRLISVSQPNVHRHTLIWISLFVTTVWLVHPIQLLPVLHVVQRMTSLSGLFLLLAFWLHLLGRERGGQAGLFWMLLAWCVAWPLSYLSKETGILFPLFVLSWEVILRRAAVGRLDNFALAMVTMAGLAVVAVTGYLLSEQAQWLWAGYTLRPFTLSERLLTEGRVLWVYLGLIILPRLSSFALFHDDIEISRGWLDPLTTLPALVGLVILLFLAWLLRKRAPLVTFGVAWFFVGHLLESTFLPLEIAHEHRNYLPLWGVLLTFAGAISAAAQWLKTLPQSTTRGIFAAGGGMLLMLATTTSLRAYQFGNEARRTLVAAEYQPHSARAQFEAANTLAGLPTLIDASSPVYSRAVQHYRRANELDPALKMASLGLIYLSCKVGNSAELADVNELNYRLRYTPFAPGDRTVLFRLKEMSIAGTICLGRSEVDSLFYAAISNDTVSPIVRSTLLSWHADYLWLHARDLAAARAALGKSLAQNPGNPSNLLKWAQLLYLSAEWDTAVKVLTSLPEARLSEEERATRNELLSALSNQTR